MNAVKSTCMSSLAFSLILLWGVASRLLAQAPTPTPTATAAPVQVRLVTREDVKQLWLYQIKQREVAKLPPWAQELLRKSSSDVRIEAAAPNADWARKFPGVNAAQHVEHNKDKIVYAKARLEPVRSAILSGEADEYAQEMAERINVVLLTRAGRVVDAAAIKQN